MSDVYASNQGLIPHLTLPEGEWGAGEGCWVGNRAGGCWRARYQPCRQVFQSLVSRSGVYSVLLK